MTLSAKGEADIPLYLYQEFLSTVAEQRKQRANQSVFGVCERLLRLAMILTKDDETTKTMKLERQKKQ